MFASQELLRKRTPRQSIGRKEYIEHLVHEFYTTTDVEAREQVTSNLVNFAYDPINFEFLRESAVVNLFLHLLDLPNDRLVINGISGICNICSDPLSRIEITRATNIKIISKLFQSTEKTEVSINILTLFYLILSEDPTLRLQICTSSILQTISKFENSSEKRLKVLAEVFLGDFFAQINVLENAQK